MNNSIQDLVGLWRGRARSIAFATLIAGAALALGFDRHLTEAMAAAAFLAAGLALLPRYGTRGLLLMAALGGVELLRQGLMAQASAPLWLTGVGAVALVVLLALALRCLRSPLTHRDEAAIDIAVTPAAVWRMIHIRPVAEYWDADVARIDPVMGAPNRFRMVRSGDRGGRDRIVEIADREDGRRFAVRVLPEASARETAGAVETRRYALEDRGVSTRLSLAVRFERPSVWTVLIALLVDPPQEELRRIKSHIESADGAGALATGR